MNIDSLYEHFLQYPVVCTDTRKLEKDCLFFALKGPSFNGNKFAAAALEAGAAYAIIDEEEYKINERCILVPDVLKHMQKLAKHHRQQLQIPVVAVVGSNGKTTTKELIHSVLKTRYKVLATPGNFNNHIGLPLTLLQLKKEHEIAVIEMGANHEGENADLCAIALPSHGIVTNNGKDHLEGFGDIEGVIRSNAELYVFLAAHNYTAFVNQNDAVLMHESSMVHNRICYGASNENHITSNHISIHPESLQPQISFLLGSNRINSVLSGDYNFDNILAALSIGLHFGLTYEEVAEGIENYKPGNLRSQLLETKNNRIFLDAYNANPSSMEASIRNFAAMPGTNKLLILGDMFELGNYEAEEHQNIANYCISLNLDAWLVGKAFSATQNNFKKFETTLDVINHLKNQPINGHFVFLKGSRGMKIESLTDFL